jgi:hypothetical protein
MSNSEALKSFEVELSRCRFDDALQRALKPSGSLLKLAEGIEPPQRIAMLEAELPADAREILSKREAGEEISKEDFDAAVAQIDEARENFESAMTATLVGYRTPDRASRSNPSLERQDLALSSSAPTLQGTVPLVIPTVLPTNPEGLPPQEQRANLFLFLRTGSRTFSPRASKSSVRSFSSSWRRGCLRPHRQQIYRSPREGVPPSAAATFQALAATAPQKSRRGTPTLATRTTRRANFVSARARRPARK